MVPKILLEKRVTRACNLEIIISKLGHWQESSLVILLEVDKRSEVGFYDAILPVGLPVSLRIKCGG